MMEIIIIAAMASNRVIGNSKTNDIPWHLPSDKQRFKQETMGHPLIMGRKTYESIGRPLPGRQTIIITRNRGYNAPGCLKTHSPAGAFAICSNHSKVFIIGGGTIYRQTLGVCSHIVLTTLTRPVQGDIFFPNLPDNTFIMESTETILRPEPYTIRRYRRI